MAQSRIDVLSERGLSAISLRRAPHKRQDLSLAESLFISIEPDQLAVLVP